MIKMIVMRNQIFQSLQNHWVFTALTAAHLLQPRHLLQHWPWTDFLEFKRFVTKIISTN